MLCNICKKKKTVNDFGGNMEPIYVCRACKTDIKKCPKCEHIKPASSFYNDSSARSGLHSWCKSCNRRATNIRKFGETKTANFVNFKREIEELRDIRSNSTDLDSYDI